LSSRQPSQRRILDILRRPSAAWQAIAAEPATVGALALRYIVPLCLVPSIAIAIGIAWFGSNSVPLHGYSLSSASALATGVRDFVFLVLTLFLLALIFHVFCRIGESRSKLPYVEALKVATFGAVPVLLAGAVLVLPALVVVTIVAGLHSLVLLNQGLRAVMGVSASESPMLLAMSMVVLTLASMALGGIAAALGFL
jgi:hypothetical protein